MAGGLVGEKKQVERACSRHKACGQSRHLAGSKGQPIICSRRVLTEYLDELGFQSGGLRLQLTVHSGKLPGRLPEVIAKARLMTIDLVVSSRSLSR